MKKHLLKSLRIGLLLAAVLSNVVLAQKYVPKYQRDDDKTIERLAKYVGEDGWIEFRQDDNTVQASEFFAKYGDNLGIGEGYEMRLVDQKTVVSKLLSQQYQLYYKGLPVEGAHYSLISQEGRLRVAVGKIILDLSRDVASPTKESDALATALVETGTTVEKIQKEGGKTTPWAVSHSPATNITQPECRSQSLVGPIQVEQTKSSTNKYRQFMLVGALPEAIPGCIAAQE